MRCPVCKAENASGPACRRCRADLSLLFALEGQRNAALAEAYRCIGLGLWDQFLAHVERAAACRADDETRRLLVVGSLVRGDFGSAWQRYSTSYPEGVASQSPG